VIGARAALQRVQRRGGALALVALVGCQRVQAARVVAQHHLPARAAMVCARPGARSRAAHAPAPRRQ